MREQERTDMSDRVPVVPGTPSADNRTKFGWPTEEDVAGTSGISPFANETHRRVHMSDQSNTTETTVEQNQQDVEATTTEATDTQDLQATEASLQDATSTEDSSTDTTDESTGDQPEVEEVAEAQPTLEDLLLRDHKERVLGKDKISASQMKSYLAFLGDKPLEHEFLTDVMGEYDLAMWRRVAMQGKSALGPKSKDVDDAYVEMWTEWRDEQQDNGVTIPKSHMWLKGIVAAALLIAEHNAEQVPAAPEVVVEEAQEQAEQGEGSESQTPDLTAEEQEGEIVPAPTEEELQESAE